MANTNSKSVVEYIYKGEAAFSKKEYEQLKKESKEFLITPLKVMALLIAISGLFAMVFEVSYFSQHSVNVYITRLLATVIAFIVLVLLNTEKGKAKPFVLVHVLLIVIIVSSGYMIYLMPKTLVVNSQIVGLMIFTSALFLSWDVKNQIIVAIYYNLVFASAILLNDKSIYFLPNMYESVIFVLFLSVISVIGSAVNFKLRMQLAERSFLVQLSEKKFHSIFENSTEGIFQSSLAGKFLTFNQSFMKILGYEQVEEMVKLDIAKDVYKYPYQRDEIIARLKEHGEINNYKVTLKKKDGCDVIVNLNDRLMTDDEGEQPYFEGNISDITEQEKLDEERRNAEEALRQEKIKSDRLAKEATKSTQIKSQFLANMSHEIRTPMNGIFGFLSLIENEAYENKKEMKQFISSAKQSADALLDIINDILDLSKIESGKMELEHTDFNLKNVIEEAIAILSVKANEKNLEILTKVDADSIIDLIGDPTRLRQIFLNLLSNAIKFTERGKIQIEVKTKILERGTVKLFASVEDEGIGIPEEKISYLFKPFSQIDSSHTRKFGGTGLGLVICKEIINMMGGEISVESIEGKGSKFSFTANFKVKEKPIEKTIKEESTNTQQNSYSESEMGEALKSERAKFKILLAEDNLINQKVAMRILSHAGYSSSAVNNGREALETVRDENFDIVLMDVQMPEMDGFTATKMIRQLENGKNKIPIIAITAHALMGDKEKCLEAGMNDYVTKPIVSEQLLLAIDKCLDIDKPAVNTNVEEKESKETTFDFDVLEKMSLGDKEFQRELLKSYIKDMNERFKKLDGFVKSGNIEKITNEAHTIKGASYSVGAKKVGDEAYGIELSGKQNDFVNISGRLGFLNKAIEETKEIIEKFLG